MRCQTLDCENEAVIHVGVHVLNAFTGWHQNVCLDCADSAASAALAWCVPTSEIGLSWTRYVKKRLRIA